MSIDPTKPATPQFSPQSAANATAASESDKTAFELAKEANKVNADLASIQRAVAVISYYEMELTAAEAQLMDMIQTGKASQPAFSDLDRKVFELNALVQGKKAAVDEAQREMDRQAILAGSA